MIKQLRDTDETARIIGSAVGMIARRHGLRHADREDMQQAAWVKVLERQDEYDPSLGAVTTWVYHLSRDLPRRILRNRQRGSQAWADRPSASEGLPVADYLTGKPEVDQIIVRLSEGQSQRQIAREMGIGREEVRRAVEYLRVVIG